MPGEVERPVPPLDRPDPDALESPERLAEYDAVRLLVERGGDVRPGFRLTDGNAAAVARICCGARGPSARHRARRGTAAHARARSRSPPASGSSWTCSPTAGAAAPIASRRCGPPSTGAISCSPPTSRSSSGGSRSSRVASRSTLPSRSPTGTASIAPGWPTLVERLASRSLVAVDHDRAEPRLHMLEPVRQYAAERLREAGERDRVVRRHLEWVVSLAAKAGIGFMREQRRWSARLRDEQDNVRQAMESALAGVDPRGGAAHRRCARLPVVHDGAAGRARVGRARARGGPRSARPDSGDGAVRGGDAGRECARL